MNEHFASGLTNISTHTLTWSVTNPKGEYWNYFYISTHTLTWSVTFRIVINVADDKNFNSHAHVERDQATYAVLMLMAVFQLTRSRGA